MRLDLKENIVFPFSDPEWALKLLKTSIAYILILPMPAVLGYQVSVIREAANGEDESLPEFSMANIGPLWVQGFTYAIMLSLLGMIPMLGVGALCYGAYMGMADNGDPLPYIFGAFLLLMLVAMVIGILVPALLLRFAMTGSPASLLDIGAAINDIKHGPGDYALIFIFPLMASVLTSIVSFTGVGAVLVLPLTVLTMIIQGRMLGNYYRAYFQ
ncbi:MAG: DUF4013 domain-containing protein [Candidatus Eremiobacteraeota bacterium]|nr:DUF4013 domain-containing protein [Candidatus Eremiobacteraeota bacterium]